MFLSHHTLARSVARFATVSLRHSSPWISACVSLLLSLLFLLSVRGLWLSLSWAHLWFCSPWVPVASLASLRSLWPSFVPWTVPVGLRHGLAFVTCCRCLPPAACLRVAFGSPCQGLAYGSASHGCGLLALLPARRIHNALGYGLWTACLFAVCLTFSLRSSGCVMCSVLCMCVAHVGARLLLCLATCMQHVHLACFSRLGCLCL